MIRFPISSPGAGYNFDDPPAPAFKEVMVHDPSIFKSGDMYYVFGSHMAAARSHDLISWEQVSTHVSPHNPFMRDVDDFKDAFEWSQSRTFWAGDIQPMPDGRFLMYYCNCQGSMPLGDIGLAVSSNAEGPYINQGMFLKSGMRWISEDGTPYNPTIHPNCVDPHAFFDADGIYRLLYGSFSGGIFIMTLDPATGLPIPGQGYGKKLMGGNHGRIEGPYMLYSPQTKYYYLFVTFGGLRHDEGYNIRVARSHSVEGPFYDAAGQEMTDVKGAEGTIFDDRSIEPFGTKIMGGYWFMQEMGEPGRSTTGHISPGHNSAYYDSETGRYFLLFHQRFPHSRATHQVRVHEMFMGEDGWFVVSPFRYDGASLRSFKPQHVHGAWKIICHGQEINYTPNISVTVTLNPDGSVNVHRSGYETGEWTLGADGKAFTITLDGTCYKGYLLRSYAADHDAWVMSFTALSAKGVALWGAGVCGL